MAHADRAVRERRMTSCCRCFEKVSCRVFAFQFMFVQGVMRGSNLTQYAQNSLEGFLNGSRLNWRETKKSES
jgi:hypothetical protein